MMKAACLCQPIIWGMVAILRDSTVIVVAAVARTCPRAILLAMITMTKLNHGFPLVSYMGMGPRLAILRAAGAPPLHTTGTSADVLTYRLEFLSLFGQQKTGANPRKSLKSNL